MSWDETLSILAKDTDLTYQTSEIWDDYLVLVWLYNAVSFLKAASCSISELILNSWSAARKEVAIAVVEKKGVDQLLAFGGNHFEPAKFVEFGKSKYPLYFGPFNDFLSFILKTNDYKIWYKDVGLVPTESATIVKLSSPVSGYFLGEPSGTFNKIQIKCDNGFIHYFLHADSFTAASNVSIKQGTEFAFMSNIGAYSEYYFARFDNAPPVEDHLNYGITMPDLYTSTIYLDPVEYHNGVSLYDIYWGNDGTTPYEMYFSEQHGLNSDDIYLYLWDSIFSSAMDYLEEKGVISSSSNNSILDDIETYSQKILHSYISQRGGIAWDEYLCPGIYTILDNLHGAKDDEPYTTRWAWELLNSPPLFTSPVFLGERTYDEDGERFSTTRLTSTIFDEDILYSTQEGSNPFIITNMIISKGQGTLSFYDPDTGLNHSGDTELDANAYNDIILDGDEFWTFIPDTNWTGVVELQYAVKDSTLAYAKYLDGYCHPEDTISYSNDMRAVAVLVINDPDTPAPLTAVHALACIENALERAVTAISYYGKIDPLTLDLDGNGLDILALDNSSTFFDLDQDGFRENVQWLGSGDGFLALDVNANGGIDDISELFGDATQQNGFLQLAALDDNSDGLISADDAAFAQLLVWRDLNGDGLSDDSELATLSETGIASITLTSSGTVSSFA